MHNTVAFARPISHKPPMYTPWYQIPPTRYMVYDAVCVCVCAGSVFCLILQSKIRIHAYIDIRCCKIGSTVYIWLPGSVAGQTQPAILHGMNSLVDVEWGGGRRRRYGILKVDMIIRQCVATFIQLTQPFLSFSLFQKTVCHHVVAEQIFGFHISLLYTGNIALS